MFEASVYGSEHVSTVSYSESCLAKVISVSETRSGPTLTRVFFCHVVCSLVGSVSWSPTFC